MEQQDRLLERMVGELERMNGAMQQMQKKMQQMESMIQPQVPRVKVFKSVTPRSIIDVQTSLNYHQEKNGERVYKGKVIINITEKDPKTNKALTDNQGNKKVLSAFMDKATAKMIFHAIREGSFTSIFGDWGETIYGGSVKNGVVRSRVLKIRPNKDNQTNAIKHLIFSIDEGEGTLGDNGSIQMKNKADMTVTSYVAYKEAMKMAHEIYDFILQEEQRALLRGEPLYTIMPEYDPQKERKQPASRQNPPARQETAPPVRTSAPEPVPTPKDAYRISIDPWKGKTMMELTDEDLMVILRKTKGSTNEMAKEMYGHAFEEAKVRRARQTNQAI